jgi:sulfate adenylyltransferase subunit 2
MNSLTVSYLRQLESESIAILREVAAEFKNPVMLYSVGKDSSVMVRLAQKAFYPGKFPFPLMHIDTGYKFPEMYEFREAFCREIGARLIVERNERWIAQGCQPLQMGVDKCCSYLKTGALLDALAKHGFDAAFGGARREEEKSRAKERVFFAQGRHRPVGSEKPAPRALGALQYAAQRRETMRVFPLSNWTEQDIWSYIKLEQIPIVPIYYARERLVVERNGILIPVMPGAAAEKEQARTVLCRFRSLGCIPCTGAIPSPAVSIDQIIGEVRAARKSERENRVIDLTSDSSMEQKKKEGYF